MATELKQLEDEGRDASSLLPQFKELMKLGDEKLFDPRNQAKIGELLDAAQKLPYRKGYAFKEPSDLAGIRKARPEGIRRFDTRLSDRQLLDHIAGAWLGRCAGCLLGKPIEGQRTNALWDFLKLTKQWPLSDYIRFGIKGKAAKKYPALAAMAHYDKIDHMPIDDDTNYTTTGYLIVKNNGADFTPADVANTWTSYIPLLATCTAERVAYRNFSMHIQPPASAIWRNPYREWIGAQIRADAFGYLNAGNPERAAEFAWRDACISHVRNGIYGEMMMAAMIAAAPFVDDMPELIQVGLSEIPAKSRLHADVMEAVGWYEEELSYDEAVARLHAKWDQTSFHHWCHTNSNAMICVIALLYGEEDFGKSICRAVQPCFDTDCNGATVGSIMGMRLGAKALPEKWTGRLHDTLETSLQGYEEVKISEMAMKTWELSREIRD